MKNLTTLLALLFCQLVCAAPFTARIDTSTTNITSTYQNVNIGSPNKLRAIDIENRSSTEIAVNCSTNSTKVAPTNTNQIVYVAGTSSKTQSVDVGLGSACWVKSMGATISTGVVVLQAYGQ